MRILKIIFIAILILFGNIDSLLAANEQVRKQPQFSKNLISNPSFEKIINGKPKGWQVVGNDSKKGLLCIKGDAYSGEMALSINASRAEGNFINGTGVYWRSAKVLCKPGIYYQAMGFMKPNKAARFLYNPLELIFFNKAGKRIDLFRHRMHNKEIQRAYELTNGEWNLIMTRPLPAPADAEFVCLEFKGMDKFHFSFHQDGIYYYYHQDKLLLDNVALWETASQKAAYHVTPQGKIGSLPNRPGSFDKYLDITISEGRPPALPAGEKRENSIFISVLDEQPGRIIFGKKQKLDFKAKVYNLLSVKRNLAIDYKTYGWLGNIVAKGKIKKLKIDPYFSGSVDISLLAPKEYGAFTTVYTVLENNQKVNTGNFGFGLMEKKPSHNSKDLNSKNFPFMLFPVIKPWLGKHDLDVKVQLLKYSGSLFNMNYENIAWFKPEMTPEQIDTEIDRRYSGYISFNRWLHKRGFKIFFGASLIPGRMDDAGLEKYSYFWERLVKKLDFVSVWFYGGETIGGTQKDPDKIYRVKGMWKYDGNVKDFFKGYTAAWKGAKKANSKCKFIMMFHNDVNAVALKHAYNVGHIKNNMFDGLAINSYGTLLHAWKNNIEVLKKHGASKKPLYVPEFGSKIAWSANIVKRKESELKQATNLVKDYLLALHRYPTIVQLTYFILTGKPGSHGITNGLDKASPFTGFIAYCMMVQKLGAKKSLKIEKVDFNEIVTWVRESDGRNVLVAWGPDSIEVKADSNITISDMMGNKISIKNPKGNIRKISLSERPVFIEG